MNATDKELLEMAARAAGLTMGWRNDPDYGGSETPCILDGEDFGCWWNPLSDDGDALRLACTLGLTVECDFHDSDTCTAMQTRGDIVADEQSGMVGEVIGAPEFAATRRAIVRAAADIGKSMTKESDHEH